MDTGILVLLGMSLAFLAIGLLNFRKVTSIRRTKKTVFATRRRAWVKKLTDREVEKYARRHFYLAIGSVLLGLFLLVCFIVLLLG